MRKAIVTALVLGLVAGTIALPAEAKKKKRKRIVVMQPAESKFFLHWDPDGSVPQEGCTNVTYMDTEEKVGTTCSDSTQVAQEVLIAAGQEPVTYSFPATGGIPLILDSSRKLTGEMVLRGTFTAEAYVELILTGSVGGTEVEIATGQTGVGNGAASNTVGGTVDLPGPAAALPFELDVNPAVNKLEATTLTLTATIRGVHRGGFDFHRTPSHLIIPTFIKG